MHEDAERPRLRLVGPDEPAPEVGGTGAGDAAGASSENGSDDHGPDDARAEERGDRWVARAASAAPVLIGIAVLVVGLAVSLRLLLGSHGAPGSSGEIRAEDRTASTAPRSTVDPRELLPIETTTAPAATAAAPPTTQVGVVAAPGPSGTSSDRSLVSVPLIGGTGAAAAPIPTSASLPTTGTVRVRLFNGFLPGIALEVWDVASSPPVRYGTVGYGALAEIAAGGRLLPNGVELRLRFVRPGGDPLATSDPSAGPWQWNLTPADASAQTLVLVPNPGFRVVRIDDRRAARDTLAGRVHVVPVVFHLVLGGTRSLPWATDAGCLGPNSTDDVEPDLAPGATLRLSNAGDASCASTAAGPLTIGAPGPYAVVGLDDRAGAAGLVALPLG